MEAAVFRVAVDWMYGSVEMPLCIDRAADMMKAGDRLGILGLRDASARICRQWLQHVLLSPWPEDRQIVNDTLHYATSIEANDLARVSSPHVLLQ